MKVYGLVGRSGSGKSYHALDIAGDLGVTCIIDDGLLIYNGGIAAGYSAKFEPNRIAAVRRAVFHDALHREQVQCVLQQLDPTACLILGTSRNMVLQICQALGLSSMQVSWLEFENLVSLESIQYASSKRDQGMHSVPVRQTRIKGSGPLVSYMERTLHRLRIPVSGTVSETPPIVVRPIFASGSVFISKRAVRQCIELFMHHDTQSFRLKSLHLSADDAKFQLLVHAKWQPDIRAAALQVHQRLANYLRESLGLPYPHIDIQIVSLDPPKSR